MEGKEMVQRYRNQINEAATPAAFGRNFVYGSARANQDRSTWPKETKRYVPAVLSHYKNIKQGRGKGQTAPAPAPAGAQPSTPAPAQPKRPAMLNGVQLGPTREAAAKLEAQTQEEESQAQGQTQVQSRAVDGLGENGAEEDTNVYLPAQAIESYNQENPGLLEDLGIVVEPVEGTSEVRLTAEQYETLEDVAPELAEAVKNDVRRGSKGMTTREVGETLKKKAEKPAWRTAEVDGITKELEREALSAGLDKAEARQWSKMAGSFIGVTSKRYNIAPSELARMKLRQGTEETQGESFGQPVNSGVDLGQKMPILDLSGAEGTGTPKELLTRLRDMALKDETWISRDAEVFATLPKGKKLKHVAYSSRKPLERKDRALHNDITGSLDELVRNAVLIESTPNNDPKKTNVLNFHRLYVPVRTDAGVQAVRIVAEELKGSDRLRPTDVELYDVVLEGQKESPAVPSDLLAEEGVTVPGAPFEVTIADMLRGVKDAEGKPYVGEEYQQASVRQSEDYDPGDPKTWPAGPARDEALLLQAWQNLEEDDEVETWPESPEKAKALELRDEARQIDAWIENMPREEFERRLRSDDPEFTWKNERGVELEKELHSLRRGLRKKKPKGAAKRLLQLIEAEEETAAQEAETYYQSAYHGSPHRGIKKMSLQHIGTGEGNLAYGYGTYSAENRDVAQDYRVALGGASYTVGGKDINLLIEEAEQGRDYVMAEVLGEIAGSHKTLEELRQEYTKENGYDDADDYQKALDKVEQKGLRGDGQLYRLEVPENDVLLDWDNPLSKQPEKVKAAIRKIAKGLSPEALADLDNDISLLTDPENTGGEFYGMLSSLSGVGRKKGASMLLLKHGIPGLRYLDGNSHNKGERTHNFVVWDEDAMSIEETYYQRQAEETENIRHGQAAMERVIAEQTDVMDAMHRDDLGSISFLWGEPGRGPKFKGGAGVSHIIAHRNAQGYDGEAVARKMVEVIAKGEAINRRGPAGGERVDIVHDGYTAVLSLYKDGERQTWLLSGWEDYKKEAPDVSSEGDGSTGTTLHGPMRARPEEGAGALYNSKPPLPQKGKGEPAANARLTVQPDGVSLIEFFKNANRSTSFHELAHHMFRVIYELSGRDGVDPQLIEDVNTILREAGVTREEFDSEDAAVRKLARTQVHEFFARGFEVYISEGKAPSKELRGVFRRLRAWMIEVYHDVVQALGIELSDEMRGVYDRLLAMPEEIDAETTVRELAVEEAALKEEIQRHEAEMREWEAQERISAEGREEWAFLEIPENAAEAVDGWLRELESYEIGRAARAEVRKTLDHIREEGGLDFDRLVRLMGDEAAGELRKKLGNFYFTSKKALTEGRGLPLDVLAEALGMDENGLVAFLEGIEGGKLKKPAPLLEVNTDTLNALIDRLGVEGAQAYLKDRRKYLDILQKTLQEEDKTASLEAETAEKKAKHSERIIRTGARYTDENMDALQESMREASELRKKSEQIKADLEATYREQREIASGLRALGGTLKAEGDLVPEQVIEPVSLTPESGRSIDEADDSELLLTADGSTELGRIDEDLAEAAGITAGEIQANVGAVRHAEEKHGAQILDAGYPDVQTFILDSLAEFNEVRRGSGDSLLLIRRGNKKEHPTVAVELVNKDGVYRVKTAWFARGKYVGKKKLLATRSASPVNGPASVLASGSGGQEVQGDSRRWSARQTSNSFESIASAGRDGNPEALLTLSEAMRRGYAMAEKYTRAAFRAGRSEARERMQLLKQKLQERQKLKKEVNRLVKGINKMAGDSGIDCLFRDRIQAILEKYDLKKRRQEELDIRAELEEYLKENPEAADTMNTADLKYLGTKTLNDMTLDDLRTLKDQIEQLHKEGHEALEARRAERREYQDWLANELAAPLLEKAKTLPQRIGAVKGPSDLDKLYVGTVKAQKEDEEDRHVGAVKGKAAALKDKINFKTLNPLRIFDLLDGGRGTREGAWVRCVYDPLNNAFDEEIRGKTRRKAAVAEKMADLGLSPEDLAVRREVKGVPSMDGKGWEVEDLLSIYAAMQYETGRKEVLFGNFRNLFGPGQWTLEAAEHAAGRCIQALTDEERAFAHVLFQDGRENFPRIQKVVAEEYNISLQQEELYMRHHVLEHDSNQGLSVLYEDDKLNDAKADAGLMGDLEKGFIVSRKNIPDGERKGIKLGMYSIWLSQVDDQEHMIAFVRPLRDIRAALTMKNPADPDMTLSKLIRETWGLEGWRAVVDYYNVMTQDESKLMRGLLDDEFGRITRNFIATRLVWNWVTYMRQVYSLPLVLPYSGWTSLMSSMAEAVRDGEDFLERVYEMAPEIAERKGDILTAALRAHEGATGLYKEILDKGLAPIGLIDQVIAAVVFKAVYNAQRKNGASHDKAVREGKHVVALTQSASHAKDATRLMREKGAMKFFTIFTSDLAQAWGCVVYDIPAALKDGNKQKALALIATLAITKLLEQMVRDGGPDEWDDPWEWAEYVAGSSAQNLLETVPLYGKVLSGAFDYAVHGGQFRSTSIPLYEGIKALTKGARGAMTAKDKEKAMFDLMDGVGLLTGGVLTVFIRRTWKIGEAMSEGEYKEAFKEAMGMRRDERRTRRKIWM